MPRDGYSPWCGHPWNPGKVKRLAPQIPPEKSAEFASHAAFRFENKPLAQMLPEALRIRLRAPRLKPMNIPISKGR
jgi:hypothetical protein